MQTIGVLGGLGPQATMDFENRVHAVSQQLIPPSGNGGYPPLVVLYVRHPPMMVGDDLMPLMPIQPEPRLLEAARRLGSSADFLVITANGPHYFQEQIEQAAGRPVLSMVEVTLAVVRERGWRAAGLLALGEPFLYREPLEQMGLRCESLNPGEREPLDRAIIRLMEGRAGSEDQAIAAGAIATLRARGVDGIVLGCTEIPLLLGSAADAPDLLNPAQLLADAAVRRAIG